MQLKSPPLPIAVVNPFHVAVALVVSFPVTVIVFTVTVSPSNSSLPQFKVALYSNFALISL